ncbi:fibrous sheath CABYR-binding protein-like [Helianthus annuus]|uniref:fibrous sheath CABYR-binding protein-like n=1 Tax=Helianthus annuus TaxID=4232 RepID=UPI0016530D19|nr:fibrous sheath CABYR-binding protein-like [Helianthus annuus]
MESDEIMSSEHEVHTSDYTSTDDDDFQPFALPDGVDEPIVGGPAADLPLAPLGDFPVDDIPLLDADHVVDPLVDPPIAVVPVDPHVDHIDPVVAHVDPFVDPPIADVPVDPHVDLVDHVDAHVDPVLAPVDPLPIEPEHALFAEHMDPPDEEIPSFAPPAGPGEGSSAHPFGHVPMPLPVMPQISPVSASTPSFPVMPFGTELERAQMPPYSCHGPSSSSAQPFRSFPPDIAARLSILEQQIASVIRTQQALEEDWLLFRRLHYPVYPPPPPPPV